MDIKYDFDKYEPEAFIKQLNENFNVDFEFKKEHKECFKVIQDKLRPLLGEVCILGGVFFKYRDTYRDIHPRLFDEFKNNQAIDIFTMKPFTELEIFKIFKKFNRPENIIHHYFFHDRNSYQHQVLNYDISSLITVLITDRPTTDFIKNFMKTSKINLKFSPTAGAEFILEYFDLDPCKIAYLPSDKVFYASRFFLQPLKSSSKDMELFGKAPYTRFLRLLMKGF